MDYFEVVAIEISDVGCVVDWSELGAYGGFTLADPTCVERRSVCGADLRVSVSNESNVEPGLTGQTPA